MDEKDSEVSEFISKYLRDDSYVKPAESLSMFKQSSIGVTETFNNIGEPSNYSEDSKDYDKSKFEENKSLEQCEKIEDKSPIAEAKKEFLDEIENQSLTLDTCSQINRDYGAKYG